MLVVVVLLMAGVAALLGCAVYAIARADSELLEQRYERIRQGHAELGRREASRRGQPTGPLHLYLSTGNIPTGRTAEILAEAQRIHDEQAARRKES